MTNVPGVGHLRDRADRLLDRHIRVDAGQAVDVHVVAAQTGQRVRERVLHRRRPTIDSEPTTGGVAERPELDAHCDPVSRAALERLSDQELVAAGTVEVTGVEEGDPCVESGVDRRDALDLVRCSVEVGHAHAAKADGRSLEAGSAKRACLRQCSFRRIVRGSAMMRVVGTRGKQRSAVTSPLMGVAAPRG